MAKRKRMPGGGNEEVNLTPMIDCTFQLIIFFIITAQMASEQAKVLPPKPEKSMAVVGEKGNKIYKDRVTVNIFSKLGDKPTRDRMKSDKDMVDARNADGYVVGKNAKPIKRVDPESESKLKQQIEHYLAVYQKSGGKKKDFFVEIRADKDIEYSQIMPVMMAAGQAGISKMAITAIALPKNERPKGN